MHIQDWTARQQLLTATERVWRVGKGGKKKLAFCRCYNAPTRFQNLPQGSLMCKKHGTVQTLHTLWSVASVPDFITSRPPHREVSHISTRWGHAWQLCGQSLGNCHQVHNIYQPVYILYTFTYSFKHIGPHQIKACFIDFRSKILFVF